MKPIRICIVDDHKLFRKLTKNYLETFPRIDPGILEAENGKELLRVLKEHPVDVVLLDINMPVMGGEETASVLLKRYPEIKIVVHGYLLKDCDPVEVVTAIEAVVDKDFYRNEVAQRALNQIRNAAGTGEKRLLEELTNREKEILRHICEEFTTKEIGIRLSISQKTVENHRMNMLQKLSARNTVGLVKYAYENGLIPLN